MTRYSKTMSEALEEVREASAKRDAMRAMGKNKGIDPADIDTDASDDDKKSASKNIIMQLRKSVSLKGNHPVEFASGKQKVDARIAQAVQDKFNKIKRPDDKQKFQDKIAKSYKDLLLALKEQYEMVEEVELDEAKSQGMFIVLEKGSKNKVIGQFKDKQKAIDMMKKNAGSKVIQIGKFATTDGKAVDVKVGDELSYTRVKLATKIKEEVELDEAMDTWKVTVVKPVNKLKKGQSVSVKANNISQALKKSAKAFGDSNLVAVPSTHFDVQKEEVELDEAPKYDLYHKDFSGAMQHAYASAKKIYGITIDPKEIDDKVATGPKRPSSGKTNTYRLKGDKGNIQIQVANLDNKRYELNMYKEEVEITEEVNLDEMKMNDPKLLKMFDKLKKGSKIKLKTSSTISQGKDYVEYIVKSKNTVNKGRVEKITLATVGNEGAVKKFLYKRDGTVGFAIGDMGASIDDIKEEVGLDEAKFSNDMIDKLKKAYEPMKGKKINPTPLMKIFDKIDSNKDGLEQLYKADIPFVSMMAMSRLMLKHNYKADQINKLGKIRREDFVLDEALKGFKVEFGKGNTAGMAVYKDKKDAEAFAKRQPKPVKITQISVKNANMFDDPNPTRKEEVEPNKPDSAKEVDAGREDKKKTRIAQLQLQIAKATETINKLNTQEK